MATAQLPFKIVPFIAFFAIAGVIGFLNHFRTIPLIPEPVAEENPVPALPEGIKAATILDVRKAIDAKSHIIVDVRIKALYDRGHIPTAVSVPETEGDPVTALFRAVPGARRSSPLILYCAGGGCIASIDSAVRLRSLGFTDLSVYEGGWQEWSKAEGKK